LPLTLAAVDRDGALAEAAAAAGAAGGFSEPLRASAPTRRGLIGLGAGAAGLGLAGRARAAGSQTGSAQDIGILNYALSLEYLQASFYSEAERLHSLHGALAEQARIVGGHERAHVSAFQKVLGSQAIKRPTFNFQGVTEDPEGFRRTAVAFEDLAVEAYKYQAPRLQSKAFLAAAIAIHSVEARHAAWIRRLAGVLPAATAFDQPLPPRRVEALVASTHFVVAAPDMASHQAPKFTG
jgi:Ferritin-like domain